MMAIQNNEEDIALMGGAFNPNAAVRIIAAEITINGEIEVPENGDVAWEFDLDYGKRYAEEQSTVYKAGAIVVFAPDAGSARQRAVEHLENSFTAYLPAITVADKPARMADLDNLHL